VFVVILWRVEPMSLISLEPPSRSRLWPSALQILGTKLTDEELQMQDDTLKLLETLMRDMEALFYKDKATGGNNRLASRAKAELDADRQGSDLCMLTRFAICSNARYMPDHLLMFCLHLFPRASV
jgi:hypothetical protein